MMKEESAYVRGMRSLNDTHKIIDDLEKLINGNVVYYLRLHLSHIEDAMEEMARELDKKELDSQLHNSRTKEGKR